MHNCFIYIIVLSNIIHEIILSNIIRLESHLGIGVEQGLKPGIIFTIITIFLNDMRGRLRFLMSQYLETHAHPLDISLDHRTSSFFDLSV
jgi:hypothetical protein